MVVSSKISGYEAWSVYMAVKLHFDEGSYDAFRFNFKGPRLKESTFLGRRDRYFFEKLAKKYQKREAIIEYFLSNVLAGHSWIGSMSDDVYVDWSGKMQRLAYIFKSELTTLYSTTQGKFDALFEVNNGQCPLFECYHRGAVSLETLTALDVLCDYTRHISKDASDPLGTLKTVSQTVRQYKPFISRQIGDTKPFREAVIKTFTSS